MRGIPKQCSDWSGRRWHSGGVEERIELQWQCTPEQAKRCETKRPHSCSDHGGTRREERTRKNIERLKWPARCGSDEWWNEKETDGKGIKDIGTSKKVTYEMAGLQSRSSEGHKWGDWGCGRWHRRRWDVGTGKRVKTCLSKCRHR